MNWDYIAGFFDGEGNLHVQQVKPPPDKQVSILIRIYSSQVNVLNAIKKFIGFGNLYIKKSTGVSELTIIKKEYVKNFLDNIKEKIIIKKEQVDYLLFNYNFERGSNSNFDVDKFRSFITRKNVEKFRKISS